MNKWSHNSDYLLSTMKTNHKTNRLFSLLLFFFSYRNKRQYQVSQTECFAQRVSLQLHCVVAVRGRLLGRPVLAAFILHTNARISGQTPLNLHRGNITTHLLPLLELCEHDNGVTLPLPHHPPEVLHRVLQRALRGDVVVLLPVALKGAANACSQRATAGGSESIR